MSDGRRRLRVFRQAADLQATSWDTLLRCNDFYSSTDWFRYMEMRGTGYRSYLVLEQDETMTGGMAVHVMGPGAGPFNGVDRRIVAYLNRSGLDGEASSDILRQALTPTLNCGGRNIGHSRALVEPGQSTADSVEQMGQLLQHAEMIARDRGLQSLCALYVDASDVDFRKALNQAGFLEFPNAQSSILTLDFDDFDGYLGRLGRAWRKSIKKERRRIVSAGVTVKLEAMNDANRAAMSELVAANLRRHGHGMPPEDILHHYTMFERAMPGRYEVLIARDGSGRPLGGEVFVQWGKELYAREVGLDYERLDGLPVHFEVGYYSLIEEALRRGVRMIDYAPESEEVKRSRGCSTLPKFGYVKCLEPAVHQDLVGLLAKSAGSS